jgi:hypothetical protein
LEHQAPYQRNLFSFDLHLIKSLSAAIDPEIKKQVIVFNAFMANKQTALMSLIRLQSMGISEDQILKMDQFLQQYNGQQYIRQ